jgi:hypothetical protein
MSLTVHMTDFRNFQLPGSTFDTARSQNDAEMERGFIQPITKRRSSPTNKFFASDRMYYLETKNLDGGGDELEAPTVCESYVDHQGRGRDRTIIVLPRPGAPTSESTSVP